MYEDREGFTLPSLSRESEVAMYNIIFFKCGHGERRLLNKHDKAVIRQQAAQCLCDACLAKQHE